MLPFRLLLALIVAVALVNTSGAGRNPDDAGSGRDAPGTQSLAIDLAGYASYRGGLFLSDTDWFRAADPSGGPACIEARAGASTVEPMALIVRGDGSTSSALAAFSGGRASAGIAVTGVQETYLALSGGSTAETGYGFQLRRVELPPAGSGDAGTSADAGGRDAPMAVSSPCITGTLGGATTEAASAGGLATAASGDIIDVYSLVLPVGGLTYSLSAPAGADLTLTLFNPSGQQVAIPIGPGQTILAEITQAGTHQLVVEGTSTESYVVGWTIGPGPGSSCRPYCMMN